MRTMACSQSQSNESVVHIFKEKCVHGLAERHFNVLNHDITFEKFECHYRCDIQTMNSVFLAEKETGPWTELGDTMYSMPVGSVMKVFPTTKYIKGRCLYRNYKTCT